jgi:hypothetical protein
MDMPYYVGAGEPEWDEYMEIAEEVDEPPISLFKYIDPWATKTRVLQFPESPGPQPEGKSAHRASAQLSSAQLFERYEQEQKHTSELALWKLSGMTAKCRAGGIKRVFGAYDGGGDESFTRIRGIEMRDGRVIAVESIRSETQGIDCEQLVENAAFALMGTYDAGEFVLRGALVIDFDACTITDEGDADVVFGE